MNTAKKLTITDKEISTVLSLREMKRALTKKLDKIEADLTKNEKNLIELLECDCNVDSSFNISVSETSKTYPKYKEEIEKRLGEEVLREIVESTTPKQFKKLVIAA